MKFEGSLAMGKRLGVHVITASSIARDARGRIRWIVHLLKPRLSVIDQVLQDLVHSEQHCEPRKYAADEPGDHVPFVIILVHLICCGKHCR